MASEVVDSPFKTRQEKILEWMSGAVVYVEITPEIINSAAMLMSKGLKEVDSLHVACAAAADCDWFFTTDSRLLKKIRQVGMTRIANPVEFVVEECYER